MGKSQINQKRGLQFLVQISWTSSQQRAFSALVGLTRSNQSLGQTGPFYGGLTLVQSGLAWSLGLGLSCMGCSCSSWAGFISGGLALSNVG